MEDLRQHMIEDMKLRGLAPGTQERYLHTIKALQIRRHLFHQKQDHAPTAKGVRSSGYGVCPDREEHHHETA